MGWFTAASNKCTVQGPRVWVLPLADICMSEYWSVVKTHDDLVKPARSLKWFILGNLLNNSSVNTVICDGVKLLVHEVKALV